MKPICSKLCIVNSSIFVFIFVYGLMYPLMNDDLARSNLAALIHHTVWNHIYLDYLNWTGRASAQLLVYLLLNKGLNFITTPLISAITAIVFILLIRLSYSIIFLKRPNDQEIKSYILLAVLIVIYFKAIFSFTEMLGFKTVSIQYLWGSVLSAWIVFKYNKPDATHKFKSKWQVSLKIGSLFLLGIFLGNYNEIVSATLLVYILYLAFINPLPFKLINLFKKIKSCPSLLSFGLGNLLGLLLLISAPGNYIRKASAMVETHTTNAHYSIVEKISILFHQYYQLHFKLEITYLIIILFLLALTVVIVQKKWATYRNQMTYALRLISGFILFLLNLSPFAYYYNGWIGGRITFIPDMFLFYSLIYLITLNFSLLLNPKSLITFIIKKLPWAILLSIMILYFLAFLFACYPQYRFNQNNIRKIEKSPMAQITPFSLPSFCPKHVNGLVGKSILASPITQDPNSMPNLAFAEYYNAHSVRELPCTN